MPCTPTGTTPSGSPSASEASSRSDRPGWRDRPPNSRLAEVVQLLQCYLRAVELGMRAAEEPLEADLDVRGLREQVLARIEVLEEQERERERLLAGVTALAGEYGIDAKPLKAVLGG